MVEVEEIIAFLDRVINDRTVPKNIRKAAEDSKTILLNGTDPMEIKISSVIHMLDEVINDPNMPMYTRTQIWNAVSLLEEKRKEFI